MGVRIYALSDVHIDYEINKKWIMNLSRFDYQNDILILAGDVSDSLQDLSWCLHQLSSRFLKVFFVPGNHDLWVIRDRDGMDSMGKFDILTREAASCGVSMTAERIGHISIVPLLGWYDYSFGQPDPALQDIWMDNHACRWPGAWSVRAITDFFIDKNQLDLVDKNTMVISFSHFLPRIDVMPNFIPESRRILYPVLGSSRLEDQIRQLGSDIHVYGHSHVNRDVCIDGVNYINNAFAYPHETRISAKQLKCIYSDH